MERTLAAMRAAGRKCGIVERFMHNKHVGAGHRSDLFNIFDVVAMDTHIIGVQVCGKDYAPHYRKITQEFKCNAIQWLNAGGRIEIWSWRKIRTGRGTKEMRWAPRMVEITVEDIK